MATCAGTRRNGTACTTDAPIGSRYCYHHDPARSEERSRKASRAATLKHSKIGKEIRDARELVLYIVDVTLDNKLPYKVRNELPSVVQLLQVYAKLTEIELMTGEKEPSFGPLPVALPEDIRQQIKEWVQGARLAEVHNSEADGEHSEADEGEAVGSLSEMEPLRRRLSR